MQLLGSSPQMAIVLIGRIAMAAGRRLAPPLAFCAALVFSGSAFANGALAIGGNPLQAAAGIAVGAAINATSAQNAETAALQNCRTGASSAAQAKALCKVIMSFRHEWLSIATDPAPKMSGFGWSVDADKATAERNALTECRIASTVERSQYCVIGLSKHDERP
jgi:hypothetical protein